MANKDKIKTIVISSTETISGTIETLSKFEFTVVSSHTYFNDDNIHEIYALIAKYENTDRIICEFGRTNVLNQLADILHIFCSTESKSDTICVSDVIADIIRFS